MINLPTLAQLAGIAAQFTAVSGESLAIEGMIKHPDNSWLTELELTPAEKLMQELNPDGFLRALYALHMHLGIQIGLAIARMQ